jgi:hypothetical protein
MTELTDLDAATDAAFVTDSQLDTVSVDGSVNRWDLGTFGNPDVERYFRAIRAASVGDHFRPSTP